MDNSTSTSEETNADLSDLNVSEIDQATDENKEETTKKENSFSSDRWTQLSFQDEKNKVVFKPDEIQNEIPSPCLTTFDENLFNRFHGSIVAMAIGDALGAHVEFRPRSYLNEHPVNDFQGGGTWGLKEGQFTDDTSMALCLALSLIEKKEFDLYDQLVRYKWWFNYGYMSSTGECFDIGAATSKSIDEFQTRQKNYAKDNEISLDQMDFIDWKTKEKQFDVYCSSDGVAGNGALMRLAPVPLFFSNYPCIAIDYSGQSGEITHGDTKARDACRYYGALIVAALRGCDKERLLSEKFYQINKHLFGNEELHPDIVRISQGSFKKDNGYDDGIRGGGYIVLALEAALWAFWSTNNFKDGALAAVNLGDDTDTTAAIYGQLAGAFYGYQSLDDQWKTNIYAPKFLRRISEWLFYQANQWKPSEEILSKYGNEQLIIDFVLDSNENTSLPLNNEEKILSTKTDSTIEETMTNEITSNEGLILDDIPVTITTDQSTSNQMENIDDSDQTNNENIQIQSSNDEIEEIEEIPTQIPATNEETSTEIQLNNNENVQSSLITTTTANRDEEMMEEEEEDRLDEKNLLQIGDPSMQNEFNPNNEQREETKATEDIEVDEIHVNIS